jgi:pyruvate dehydrogenase E1 component alpha subunit
MDAHTTTDDPTRYRLSDELELWKLKDPIERVRVNLIRHEDADQDFFDSVQADADQLATEMREFCVNMPDPPPERIFSKIYSEPHAQLDAQRDEFLEYVSGFEGGAH